MFVLLGLAQAPSATAAADPDRRLAHSVFLGVGATWTESGRFRQTVYPGAMLGFDLALGRNVALGLSADFTYIDERPEGPPPVSTNHRLITGLDFKLLPLSSGRVRPWVTVSAAGSVVHDTGYGYGLGAGALWLANTPTGLFVDVRRYHFVDMEQPSFEQVMLRAGVLF
jgi:hypothetical protein